MSSVCIKVKEPVERWQRVSPLSPAEPVDVAAVVLEVPGLLAMLDPAGAEFRAAMPSPGSTSGRVLVSIDEKGKVQLVACPATGGEVELSPLVADVLSTAGRFWHQHFDALAKPFKEYLGVSLGAYFKDRRGKTWSEETFRAGVEKSMSEGRFPVLVLVPSVDEAVQDMLAYLGNMNLDARVLGYSYAGGGAVEVLRPLAIEVGGATPEPAPEPMPAPAPEPAPEPAKQPEAKKTPEPEPRAIPGQIGHGFQFTPVVGVSTLQRQHKSLEEYAPFEAGEVSNEQAKILARLVQLDDLGLNRQGLEYFLPGAEFNEEAEGTIVISVSEERWPFPKENEIIIVVNTGEEHLAGYLKLTTEEVEDFLNSLPRVHRKEHKGCLLLKASTIHEADQLINELKALKEVA